MSERTKLFACGDESGSVIPFVALTGIILVFFAAWVIDAGFVSNSREQAQQGARLACIAAIEAHFANRNGTLSEKVDSALLRAKGVSLSQVTLGASDFSKAENRPRLKRFDATGTDEAVLTPGVFYYDKIRRDEVTGNALSTPQSRCPGGADSCFVPTTDLNDPNATVSAYQISGNFYRGFGYRLGRALGIGTSPSQTVKATCAVVPRHIAFAVDMSPSITRETHLLNSVTRQQTDPLEYGRSSEFAYFLKSDNPELEAYLASQGKTLTDQTKYSSVWPWFAGTKTRAEAAASPSPPNNPAPPAPGTPQFNTVHYIDDYVKVKTLSDADFSANRALFAKHHPDPFAAADPMLPGSPFRQPNGLWYHVDQFTSPDGAGGDRYSGPEPLTSTFFGIRQAILAFKQRAVAGDKIAIVAFDSELTWPRIFLPTDDFDYLDQIFNFRDGVGAFGRTVPLDDANGDKILDAGINLADTTKPGFVQAIRHQLFPGVTVDGGDIKTNTTEAVSVVSSMLKSVNSASNPSQDSIVLITDGKANCTPTQCQNIYDSYKNAYTDLLATIQNTFEGKNVPLHTIMLGSEVAPHTIAVAREPFALASDTATTTDCLSDDEARRTFRPFVGGGKAGTNSLGLPDPRIIATASSTDLKTLFLNGSAENPFVQANQDAYQLSALTQGLWVPLRPPSALVGGVCPKMTCTRVPQRQLTDPECRTVQKQVSDAIDKIIGATPYMIVDLDY